MNLLKNLYFLSLVFLVVTVSCSEEEKNCRILRNSKMQYANDEDAIVIIKNNKLIEFNNHKKYFIKSNLNWVNDCEYNATMTEIYYPGFPLGVGAIMNVKIRKIDGKYVYYTSTIGGQTLTGNLS